MPRSSTATTTPKPAAEDAISPVVALLAARGYRSMTQGHSPFQSCEIWRRGDAEGRGDSPVIDVRFHAALSPIEPRRWDVSTRVPLPALGTERDGSAIRWATVTVGDFSEAELIERFAAVEQLAARAVHVLPRAASMEGK